MKRIILAGLMVMVCGGVQASVSRDSALQADGWRVMDSSNIAPLPGELANYNRAVYGELNSWSGADDFMGVHLPLGPGVLAIYGGDIPAWGPGAVLLGKAAVSTTMPIAGMVPAINVGHGDLFTAGAPDGRIVMMYGLGAPGALSYTLGLDYGQTVISENEQTNPSGTVFTTTDKSSLIGISGGINIPLGIINPLSLGLRYSMPSFESSQVAKNLGIRNAYKSTAGSGFEINMRGRLADIAGEGSETFFFVGLGFGSLEGESSTTAYTDPEQEDTLKDSTKKLGVTDMVFGISNCLKVGNASMILTSVGFETNSNTHDVKIMDWETSTGYTTSTSTSTMSFPVVLGLETQLFPWLAARFSSSSRIINRTTMEASLKDTEPEDKSADKIVTDTSSQSFAIGGTVTVTDRFFIEGVMNESWLFTGPYFIGGAAGGLFTNVSLVYRF